MVVGGARNKYLGWGLRNQRQQQPAGGFFFFFLSRLFFFCGAYFFFMAPLFPLPHTTLPGPFSG